eukprot:JP436014.1.p1 GENE.JP436014.1~~JP436014.1.p1  ORF type:complete len:308 (-),score=74.43 JP436014.1:129-1052(-)
MGLTDNLLMSSAGSLPDRAFSLGSQSELQYWRHFIQLIVFVVLNGKLFGLASTGVIVPYLHPTQSPFSTVHGAWDSLEYTLSRGFFPLLVAGVIFLTAILVGRLFCGWACPLGLVQDILAYLPFKKDRLTAEYVASVKDIKWVLVLFSVVTAALVGMRQPFGDEKPVGVFTDAPFSVLSPSGTLFCYLPWMMMWNANVMGTGGVITWVKVGVAFAVLIPGLYIPRFFCRYVCPLGAVLGHPFSAFKLYRLKRSANLGREEANRVLGDVCPMGVTVAPEDSAFVDSASCINCGKCVTEIPLDLSFVVG